MKRLRLLLRPGVRLDYRRVLDWARAFAPDVIYSQATPYPMYTWWLPRWLARDLRVPLVNHIMDDWPAALLREWPPGIRALLGPLLARQLQLAFAAAARNLAISRQMAEAFAARYGTTFVPIHNAVDLQEWTQPKSDYAPHGDEFRVVYLGALAEQAQVLSLREVALTIARLRADGRRISLTVHTGSIYLDLYRKHLAGIPGVTHGGTVTRGELCSRLATADLLVLPVNFDAASRTMMRYSMPTKAPEYMASGAPVLVYAPAEVPPAAYALESGWGYVVHCQEAERLKQALTELMDSEELRAHLGRRGRELALRHHDAAAVRQEFREILCRAARNGAAST